MFRSSRRRDAEDKRVIQAIREAAPRPQDTDAVYARVLRDVSQTPPAPAKQAGKARRPLHVILLQLTATMVFVTGLAALAIVARTPDSPPTPHKPPRLPVVGSFKKLKAIMKTTRTGADQFSYWGAAESMDFLPGRAMPSDRTSGKWLSRAPVHSDTADYISQTNVQVQGVDEADIIKTDGTYIYQITSGGVRLTKTRPAANMAVAATLKEGGFTPFELYVDDDYLVVLGTTGQPYGPDGNVRADIYEKNGTVLPRKTREIEIEGEYVSSRRMGPALYLVTNKYVDLPRIMKNGSDPGGLTPSYRDSAAATGLQRVKYSDVSYFPGAAEPNYLIVAGVDLGRADKQATVHTFLGAGRNIYSSTDNLYVAATTYENGEAPSTRTPQTLLPRETPAAANTEVYKFSLLKGDILYAAKGEVPGTVLNQFSMDEYKGHFRLATTTGEVWAEGDSASKNHVYALDSDLKTVGSLNNVAPGERIYSARFMGERAYMVTFKQVDPLFVIDLKDPGHPAILGELKIPGYSDYLHPLDEDHIIGFGKDVVVEGGSALNQGMKIALFDVSDVRHPVEKFKVGIGGRGTESELLRNHKALMIDARRGLMAFPVTVMKADGRTSRRWGYSGFEFQGAYVYDIGVETGIDLRGKVTHLTPEQSRGAYDRDRDPRQVKRTIYIGETLYVVSDKGISAHDLETMRELGSVGLVETR